MGLAVKIRGSRRWGNDIRVPQSLEGLVSGKNEYSPTINLVIYFKHFSQTFIENKLKIDDKRFIFKICLGNLKLYLHIIFIIIKNNY